MRGRGSKIKVLMTSLHHMVIIALFCLVQTVHAFSWHDLWATKDQQAKAMMEKGQFNKAAGLFNRDDWRATSAYRAGDYQQAATLYQSFKTEDAYYNQGNAEAHLHQYEQAIHAYDKTLGINPNNQDALHNRKIVEDLLKKDKQQQQNQQNQDKQNQDKQNQDKQNQDKQNQDKQNQDKQNQDKQNQDKQNQDKQNQDKQNQDKQNQDKQNQDKQNQDKQNQDKQNQDKQDQDKNKQNLPAKSEAQKQADREKQQAKEQWLRLVPDDPGGLMREKFLRDHLRRQRGWAQ